MQSFILRAVKPKQDDVFHFYPNDEYIYFYCKGLVDLQKTIRQITPKGYRIRTSAWFSKYLKMNSYDLVLKGGFITQNEKYRIIKITEQVKDYKEVEFTNRENITLILKAIVTESEINWLKTIFV